MDDRNQTPAGFARLASRISAWTTNGLFSALILVIGLGFGRQVVRWWHAPPIAEEPLQPLGLLPREGEGLGESVSFGSLGWSVDRRSVAATAGTIRSSVASLCEQCVSHASCPEGACGPAEAKLIRALASSRPVASEPAKWTVYDTISVLPMAVGLRTQGDRLEGDTSPRPDTCRVAAWCVAIPSEPDFWTVLCFSPAAGIAGEPSCPQAEIPLPPGSRRLLAFAGSGGGSTQVFLGPGEIADWQAFFVHWFEENGWKSSIPGPQREGAWYGRYSNPNDNSRCCIDIQLSACEDRTLAGVLVASPPPAPNIPEKDR